ncbi:MAG: hypothetical protein JWR88_2260 [Pseudonocardia sp.]|jgi:hypothetical protein|nr:hypothetical protein [Pseudonocardia sp.]
MVVTQINDEVAIQYAVVRRTNPFASVDDVVKKIIERLDELNLVPADADAPWDRDDADGPDELTVLVRNFVLSIEGDQDGSSS